MTMVPGAGGFQGGQQGLGDAQRAEHVHVVHPLPVVDPAALHRVEPRAPPALLTSSVTGPPAAAAVAASAATEVVGGDVTLDRGGGATRGGDLGDQGGQPVGTAGGGQHVEALAASRRAVAAPIPLEAPVTIATGVMG